MVFGFWMFVIFFAIIGAMRGWAKELLVIFSLVLAIFIIIILERFAPFVTDLSGDDSQGIVISATDFWVRASIVIVFAFFGYQTPRFPRISSTKLTRERVQDVVLGLLAGAANGYMVMGSLWFYLHQADYKIFENQEFSYIISPVKLTEMGAFLTNQNVQFQFLERADLAGMVEFGQRAVDLIGLLPPEWLVVPWIYFAVALAMAFVVIVFV